MKYFEKSAAFGIPKSDLERVMTHYKVSEKEAKKMMKQKSIKELLPPRGSREKRAYMDQASVIAMGSNWGKALAQRHIKAKNQQTLLRSKSNNLKYTKRGVVAGALTGVGTGVLLEKASPAIVLPAEPKGIKRFFTKPLTSKQMSEIVSQAKKLKIKNYLKKSTILAGAGGVAGMAIGANIDFLRKKV